ncbi:MAG: hypothetical protein VCA13_03740 [PS1 clade bacterium]
MKNILLLAAFFFIGTNVFANDEGKELHSESCIMCHNDTMYTRLESKIENHYGLRRQVSFCSSNLGIGWFPDEEDAVVDFLNSNYYKFNN